MSKVMSSVVVIAIIELTASLAHAQLPTGWTDQDIGTCTPAGSATYSADAFTVNGSGTNFNSSSDNFNYCYQSYTGNFTLIARVTSNANNGYSGIMVRESLAPNARMHTLFTFPTGGAVWALSRNVTGATATVQAGPTFGFPLWMKIQRAGNVMYSFSSGDGVHWQPMAEPFFTSLAATVYAGLCVCHNSEGALATTTYDNVSISALTSGTSVPGTVTDSWVGNTGGNGAAYQEMQISIAGMYTAPDGTCYGNAGSLEVSRMWGVYKNGATLGYIDSYGFGGAAITGDGTYLYLAQAINSGGPPSGTVWYTVRRVNESNWGPAPFTGGCGNDDDMLEIGSKTTGYESPGNVWGLACNSAASTLYASDTINGKIDVINTATMAITGSWTLPDGDTPYGLTWDSTNNLLWVIVQNSTGREIWAYNASGEQQTDLTITTAVTPVSIVAQENKLFVADNGPDQNVKVFTNIGTVPHYWIYYGVPGGAFTGSGSGVGTIGNWRLNGLTALGVDSSGNIYVSCNGHGPDLNENGEYHDAGYGGTLESYSGGTRALNWRMQGLEFFDVVNIDPGDETSGYGNTCHYTFNWDNTTPGSEWTAYGDTVNWQKYGGTYVPNTTSETNTSIDWRLGTTNTNFPQVQTFRVGSAKFLCVNNNATMNFYRFETSQGETAIPCAQIFCPPIDPGVNWGLQIWTDANGDGVQQSTEVAVSNTYTSAMYAPYVDTNGKIWSNSGSDVLGIPCTVNSVGAVEYSWTGHTSVAMSSLPGGPNNDHITNVNGNGDCNRLVYDASTDTMYLLGFTTNYPSTAGSAGAGTAVICYTSWSTTPTFSWETELPIYMTGNDQTSFVVEAMAGAGKYLFVQFQQGVQTLVLNKVTGAQVGSIYPDPVVIGGLGWTDFARGISAYERSNGEYIITLEDDVYNKSIIYRWTGAP